MKIYIKMATSLFTILMLTITTSKAWGFSLGDIQQGECKTALGMEEGRIPDHAISASSSYEPKSVGPQNARIRQEKNGGAWCPKAQISSEIREYLEVDLQKDHLITWTETQGRFGNGQGQEYAEAFLIEYWREALQAWVIYKDARGEKVLTGNKNTYLVVKQRLELPFVASKVRFIPYSEHPRTVCMRVELYGCTWEQSVIRYTAPRGGIGNLPGTDPSADLEDVSYDGVLDGNILRGGLGQLIDGLYGDDDFQSHIHGENSGSRWVGWHNSTIGPSPVEIEFEFDGVREFQTVHIHMNNMFSRRVQVFSRVDVYLGVEPINEETPAVVKFEVREDRTRESARNVSVPLHGRPGKYMKLHLHFSNDWILVSEVAFDSVPVPNNMTDELLDRWYGNGKNPANMPPVSNQNSKNPGIQHVEDHPREVTPATSPASSSQTYVGLIGAALAVAILALACVAVFAVWWRRRGRKKVALLHKHTALVCSTGGKPMPPGSAINSNHSHVAINMSDLKHMTTPIIGGNTLPGCRSTRLSVKKPGQKSNGGTTGALYAGAQHSESDSETSSVYHEPYKLLPSASQEYGCLLKKDAHLSTSKSADYAEFSNMNGFQEDGKFGASFYSLTAPPKSFQTPTKQPNGVLPPSENYYAATDIVKSERREQHLTPGRFTSIKVPEGPPLEGVVQLLDFPRHRLRLREKLGEGSFGAVHLCEAEGLPDFNGGSSFHKKQIVIVKSLRRGCVEGKRREFLRETSWLAGVRDPNLARVVGLCSQDEPMCCLLEHSELGELPRYFELRRQRGEDDISYGCLIYLATQIASGMKYLESLDLVHRDLSARNCVVDSAMRVKVSDHAMWCDRYSADYYLSDTQSKLPIRWMSWEALLLGKHTTKSDVWSFAVCLWEILVRCEQQPHAELTDLQVVENASRWCGNGTNGEQNGCPRHLARPQSCPREIYDLMAECWKRNAADRPRFHEIHLFLQRKNLGFHPHA